MSFMILLDILSHSATEKKNKNQHFLLLISKLVSVSVHPFLLWYSNLYFILKKFPDHIVLNYFLLINFIISYFWSYRLSCNHCFMRPTKVGIHFFDFHGHILCSRTSNKIFHTLIQAEADSRHLIACSSIQHLLPFYLIVYN